MQKVGFPGVIKIRGVIRNFIDTVDELSLERRLQIQKIFGKLGKLRDGILARMLDNAFAHLKSEIEPGKVQVALLELLHDAQRLQIMIEPDAERAHQLVELTLSAVTERRMPEVVDECQGFGEFRVQAGRRSHRSGDLRDFEGMCEAGAKMIGEACSKDLGLRFRPAKRSRMNDAVAVAGIFA